jgi:hypothetical protein
MALTPTQHNALLLDIRAEAKELADSGFLTKDEAIQELFDTFDYDRPELIAILSETWPEKTDVDRLFEAFAHLEEHSVIALHNPQYTPPGAYEALDLEGSRRLNPEHTPIGGVAYCGVSIANALANNIFPIFAVTHGDELIQDTAVGKMIIKTLDDSGLSATFDEGGNVILATMTWQKRTITEPLPKFDFGDEAEDDRFDGLSLAVDLSEGDDEYAEELIWSGFLTKDEILAEVAENTDNSDEITKFVAEMWQKKLDEEKTWPEVTDVDRLHQAFAALEAKSILAFHNLGNTNSDAMYLAGSEWERRGGEATGLLGSVSYHSQALHRARTEGVFHLGFDCYPGSTIYPTIESRMNAVGMIVTKTLQEHGLKADWNGDIDTKIEVTLDWKKRAIFEPLPKLDEKIEPSEGFGPDLLFVAHPRIAEIAVTEDETRKRTIN